MAELGYALEALGQLLWAWPFVRSGLHHAPAVQVDRRARWGILLQGLAFPVVWSSRFWLQPVPGWRVGMAAIWLALASLLSWSAVRALGRNLRVDAALGAEHDLVRSGPYRVVRHPVYTSLFCLLLGQASVVAGWRRLGLALLLMVVGTEIRVRLEDRLLAARFGEAFASFRSRVSAYLPGLR
ncbi:MAG: isoprenylcysteine carboxylmethyltransferase family protein [Acidobacteriota bacterium]|nr:isoprenylcysteine carboxylmethyltransferase family protein [Acidobacteriota bacterium]